MFIELEYLQVHAGDLKKSAMSPSQNSCHNFTYT